MKHVDNVIKDGVSHKERHQSQERYDSNCIAKTTRVNIAVEDTHSVHCTLVCDAAKYHHGKHLQRHRQRDIDRQYNMWTKVHTPSTVPWSVMQPKTTTENICTDTDIQTERQRDGRG